MENNIETNQAIPVEETTAPVEKKTRARSNHSGQGRKRFCSQCKAQIKSGEDYADLSWVEYKSSNGRKSVKVINNYCKKCCPPRL